MFASKHLDIRKQWITQRPINYFVMLSLCRFVKLDLKSRIWGWLGLHQGWMESAILKLNGNLIRNGKWTTKHLEFRNFAHPWFSNNIIASFAFWKRWRVPWRMKLYCRILESFITRRKVITKTLQFQANSGDYLWLAFLNGAAFEITITDGSTSTMMMMWVFIICKPMPSLSLLGNQFTVRFFAKFRPDHDLWDRTFLDKVVDSKFYFVLQLLQLKLPGYDIYINNGIDWFWISERL